MTDINKGRVKEPLDITEALHRAIDVVPSGGIVTLPDGPDPTPNIATIRKRRKAERQNRKRGRRR